MDAVALRRIDGLVATFAIGVLILVLAVVDLGGYWLRLAARSGDEPVAVVLAGRSITLPGAWIARGAEGEGRIDLAIPFAAVPGRPAERLFVTATAADGPARGGLGPHHARFLTAVARSHPSGLVERRFRDGTPFDGEALYLSPPDGAAFTARCAADGGTADGADCLAELVVDGIDLRVRFATARLDAWEAITTTLRRTFGAPASRDGAPE